MYRKFDVPPLERPVEYFEDIDIWELDWVEGYLPCSDENLKKHKAFFYSHVKSYSDFSLDSKVCFNMIRAYCFILASRHVRPWIEFQRTPDVRPKFLNFKVPEDLTDMAESLWKYLREVFGENLYIFAPGFALRDIDVYGRLAYSASVEWFFVDCSLAAYLSRGDYSLDKYTPNWHPWKISKCINVEVDPVSKVPTFSPSNAKLFFV